MLKSHRVRLGCLDVKIPKHGLLGNNRSLSKMTPEKGRQERESFMEAALQLRSKKKTANESLKWGLVNGFVCFLLFGHIYETKGCYNHWWIAIEYVVAAICALNLLAHLFSYVRFVWHKPLQGTRRQRELLGFPENDDSFKVVEPAKGWPQIKRPNLEAFTLPLPSIYSRKYNKRNSTPQRGSGSPTQLDGSSPNVSGMSNKSSNFAWNSTYASFSYDDFITDEESLQKLSFQVEERESGAHDSSFDRWTTNHVRSFGGFAETAAYLLKTSAYQLAPLNIDSQPNKELCRDSSRTSFGYMSSDILAKKTPEQLSQYVANLRKWIAVTILHRLVKKIDNINESFKSRGISEMKIGNIGLERLRKTVENQQFVNQYMPMLPLILPFLEISSNQEYLVQRIKDLANGHCIGDYRWNSGSSNHGQKWDEHLPTDSSIIFHLLCVYLDTQLMPLPQGGGRPFFSRYVVMNDEKRLMNDVLESVQNRAHCAILCTNTLQPKFNFISDKKIHHCSYERNNLFHVIIQFLIYMKEHQDGLLEGVNLGRSGINILCVIDD